MSVFRSIFLCSVLVGLIVGLAVSLAQHFGTMPLILNAEVYEEAAESSHAALAHEAMGHEQHEGAWEPANGFERNAFTVVANILTATGYALVLTGLIALRGKPVGWRQGLLWGLCGFVAVMVAPSLGLPPELPGIPAAPLLDRQLWWVGTVVATGAGLALLLFRRTPWAAVLAIILLVLPHLIGAPQLAEVQTNVPEPLSHRFLVTVTLTSLLFWALLGSLSGALYRRFAV